MSTRWRVEDEEILEAVQEASDAGETDIMEGGVPPSEVADRVGIGTSAARERCQQLEAEGELEECHGVNPETSAVRTSYLPLEEVTDGI